MSERPKKAMKPEPRHLLWHQHLAERGREGGGGVISVIPSPHGFVEHSRWRPTNQSFTLPVDSSRNHAAFGLELEISLPSPVIFFAILFLHSHENEQTKKTQTSGTGAEPASVCISHFIYGTDAEPHEWAGGGGGGRAAPEHMLLAAGEEK